MRRRLKGRVWKFGDGISTDHIISARYLGTTDPKVFADHAMENVDPEFSKKVKPGDMIVAGHNFGCGSSREQAPLALKSLGISAIVAESFARIFFRNSINIGLPAVECKGISEAVSEGEVIEVDLADGYLATAGGRQLKISSFPPRVLEILQAGGLIPKLRAEFQAASGSRTKD
ncbi:MAG: 3-isopropylmalate dehydratase small subunit [Thermoplasmata archaeon]